MNFSDPVYFWLAIFLGVPTTLLAGLDFLLRKRGGFLTGWVGAIFIAIGWTAAMALILARVA